MGVNLLPRDIDLYTKNQADKNRWQWIIRIDKIRYRYVNGLPVIGKQYAVLPEFLKVTTTGKEQEFELIHALTTDFGNFGAPSETKLYKALKDHPDQLYRLTVFKQSRVSKITGKLHFAFWGWCLISKNKDKILWETSDFQQGAQVWRGNFVQRDPQDDAKRKHYSEIPSGGVDYVW